MQSVAIDCKGPKLGCHLDSRQSSRLEESGAKTGSANGGLKTATNEVTLDKSPVATIILMACSQCK